MGRNFGLRQTNSTSSRGGWRRSIQNATGLRLMRIGLWLSALGLSIIGRAAEDPYADAIGDVINPPQEVQ
jgi:hypothetical protein